VTDTERAAGGTAWELQEAIRLMGEAIASGNLEAIATAMRRHAEALSNQSMTTVVPTFERTVESLLNKHTTHQDQRFNYMLVQLDAFLTKGDARFDEFARVQDQILTILSTFMARTELEERLDRKRERLDDHEKRITRLEQHLGLDAERNDR